jgi:hypothetical protein
MTVAVARGGMEPAASRRNLLLPLRSQFGRLRRRQPTSSAGVARGGPTLAAELKLELGERGHDGGHGAPSWRTGIDAFAQRAQQNSALTKISNSACHLGSRAAKVTDRSDHHGVALA